MSETRWTPGPWVVHPNFPDAVVPESDARKAIGSAAEPAHEAQFYAKRIYFERGTENPAFHRSRVTRVEAIANARLIAMAPSMFSLLSVINFDVQRGEPCPICSESPHRNDCALARTLIEAEGRAASPRLGGGE